MLSVIFTFRSKEYGGKKPGCRINGERVPLYVSTLVVTLRARNCVRFWWMLQIMRSFRKKTTKLSTRNGLNAASGNKFVTLHLSIQVLDLCVPSSNRRARWEFVGEITGSNFPKSHLYSYPIKSNIKVATAYTTPTRISYEFLVLTSLRGKKTL